MLLDTFDQDKAAKLFHLFARKPIWHCPTVVSLNLRESNKNSLDKADLELGQAVYKKQLDLIRQMRRSGVRFLAGTDLSPQEPVANLHEELRLLTKAGFTPLQAIQTATRNPAIFLNRGGEFGSVAVGNVADLVLLEADPSVDISATRRIAGVLVNGRFFDKPALDRMRNQRR